MVERAKAGDKCVFTGTFIVVPDVSQMSTPGMGAEVTRSGGNLGGGGRGVDGGLGSQGVTGLKSLGVRDLQYKTAFLSCMVNTVDAEGRVSVLSRSCSEAGTDVCSLFLLLFLRLARRTCEEKSTMDGKINKNS